MNLRHRTTSKALASWGCVFLLATWVAGQLPSHLDPGRILVIYDLNSPDANGNGVGDSEDVALAYQMRRGVPPQNLVPLVCSPSGTSYSGTNAWTNFFQEVRQPVWQALTTLGITSIDTLLFCHGVPHIIAPATWGTRSLDQTMRSPSALNATSPPYVTYWYGSPYFEGSPGVGVDRGHFDHSITFSGQPFYLASRLDGPDVQSCLELIEGALYGDRYIAPQPGYYQGNIYIDTRYSTYANPASLPYPQLHGPSYVNADQDMAWGSQWMFASGFPVLWENTASSLEIGEPGAMYHTGAPAQIAVDALFYYGWYNYGIYHDVWSWLPGSVACDLNSNSIQNIHLQSPGTFIATAMRRGLTAGAGAIAEPYLNGHPFPEVLIKYVLDGKNFAEAASVSDPTHHWRSLYVGDPLYCPLRMGKVPELDLTAPPVPTVSLVGATATEATYRIAIDTQATDPDLMTIGGAFGVAPVLSQILSHGAHYRLAHDVTLFGLTPGVFHRAQLEIRDPVGQTTPAPELLIFDTNGVVGVSVQADAMQLATAQPFTFECAMAIPGGVVSLTGFSLTLDVPAAGIFGVDLLPILGLFPVVLHGDGFGNVLSLEVPVASGLPAGNYVVTLSVTAPQGSAAGTLTLTVS